MVLLLLFPAAKYSCNGPVSLRKLEYLGAASDPVLMSEATTDAAFVYFIKSASPVLPDDEEYFMSCDLQSPHSFFQSL